MNLAQLLRFLRRFGVPVPPPPAAPTLVSPPVIVSSDPGVYKEGVLLAVTPGTYNNAVGAPTYAWKRGGTTVGTGATYVPDASDVGANITVEETVANVVLVTLTTASAAVGPVLEAVAPGETTVFTVFPGGTLTVDEALPSGEFLVNGTWAVLDTPANLIASEPAGAILSGSFDTGGTYTNRAGHGLMIDPGRGITGGQVSGTPTGWQQAYDALDSNQATSGSTILDYSATLQKAPELAGATALVANTQLVKVKSVLTPNREGRENISDMGSLTILTASPPANSFRPHSTDADKTPRFTLSDVDVSWLPNDAVPPGVTIPAAATIADQFARMWQTAFTNNLFCRGISPKNNMPHAYGTDIANMLGLAMNYLCYDTWTEAEKLEVAVPMIQVGLDLGRRGINGGEFPSKLASFGGGSHWFKGFIIFAWRCVRDGANTAAIAELEALIDYEQTKLFADDLSAFYLNRERMEAVRSTPDPGYDASPFEHYAEGVPEWFSNPSDYNGGGSGWNVKYRLTYCPSHTGVVMALLRMGLEDAVNSPALFDYHYRWVNWVALEGTDDLNVNSEYPLALQAMIAQDNPPYPSAAPVLQRIVARDDLIWFEFDKLLDLTSVPATSAFTVTVNGVSATLTESGVYGHSLFVRRNLFLAGGETVTAAYTQPVSNKARTLGNTNVASIAATAATNLTASLPPAATVRQQLDNSADPANRQVFGTVRVPGNTDQGLLTGVDRFLFVMRVRFNNLIANDMFFANATGSTTALKFYFASVTAGSLVTAPRCFIAGSALRAPAMLAAADVGVMVTMAFAFDFTATGVTNKFRAAIARPGGQTSISTSSSTDPAAGFTVNMATAFSGGMSLLGAMSTLNSAPDAHMEFAYFDYGRSADGFTLPADLTSAAFAHDFDPGGNGENITGGAPWFFWAGTAAEANSYDGLPNRGRAGALNMYPKREPHVYPIIVGA